MHDYGRNQHRSSCPTQPQKPFEESAAAGIVLKTPRTIDAGDRMKDQRALEEDLLVNRYDEFPMVNKDSNSSGLADRDCTSFSQGEKESVATWKMGQENKSPVRKEGISNSVFKVYSRRRTCQIAKSMARLNLGPVLNEIGSEKEARVMVTGSNCDLHKVEDGYGGIQSGPLTPKQDPPPHSPNPPSSFNNDFSGVEEDQHWEIARQLGLASDEYFKNRGKESLDEDNISHLNAVTAEMGNKTIDP